MSTFVRLNLGCGDKILDGYTNVDIVDERAGQKPDVNCDVRQLTVFEDNYADEILAVHVVEHFWRWEVQAIIQEWMRVLKPGGKMILECPNLISACQEVLKDPLDVHSQHILRWHHTPPCRYWVLRAKAICLQIDL